MITLRTSLVFNLVLLLPSLVQGQQGDTITTVAGGVPRNVNPLSVAIGLPQVAKDPAGNVYVSDESNNLIYTRLL